MKAAEVVETPVVDDDTQANKAASPAQLATHTKGDDSVSVRSQPAVSRPVAEAQQQSKLDRSAEQEWIIKAEINHATFLAGGVRNLHLSPRAGSSRKFILPYFCLYIFV
jgi:hypothetical protein